MNRIMIMRPILFFILGAIGIFFISLLGETLMAQARDEAAKKEATNPKKYDPNTLFTFTIDSHPEQTKQHAMEEYKKCPPLRRDRFRRRIKMLWGIDIKNYPENALLWFGPGDGSDYEPPIYKLSLKYQTISGYKAETWADDAPFYYEPIPPPPPPMRLAFRQYLLYNDPSSYHALYTYFQKFRDNQTKTKDADSVEKYWYGSHIPRNLLADINRFIYFQMPVSLIHYIDITNTIEVDNYLGDLWTIGQIFANAPNRSTDMRNDMLTLYIMQEQKKDRKLANNNQEQNKQQYIRLKKNGGYPNDRDEEGKLLPEYGMVIDTGDGDDINFWDNWGNYGAESFGRSTASSLSQLLQLKGKSFDKAVLLFLSGQIKEYDSKNMVANIKKNNYFGYTLLREYDNNLMREMPTLAKIGTSFQGAVKQANTLLYLEPFKESYSIDTLQTYETFTAYEMGHDDYYFVEVEKPVESPIAGTDGYAKIVDRTEIVHGYIEKSKVVPYTDAQLLTHPHFTDHTTSKKGVINDKDGYVNVRAERNTKSEVVDKLVGIEFVEYWQLMGNWYIVETRNGKRGFVYKDRIKENK